MRFLRTLLLSAAVVLLLVAAGCIVVQTGNTANNSSAATPQAAAPVSTAAVSGTAGTGCPAGMMPCSDGYCHDTTSDHDACGGCGNVCPAGDVCSSSVCAAPVTQGTTTAATTSPAVTTATTTATATQTLVASKLKGISIVTVATTPGDTGGGCASLLEPYSLTSISPVYGPVSGGTEITITGSGFQNAVMAVYFGNTRVTSLSNSGDGTKIWVTSPKASAAGMVDIRVVGASGYLGDSGACATSFTTADRFTYTA